MTNTRSNHSAGASTRWWLGIATGTAVATLVTVIVVIWEWVENPGGIFRSEIGTHWNFVLDTAISWFVPTLVYVAITASVIHLAWTVVRKLRRKEK